MEEQLHPDTAEGLYSALDVPYKRQLKIEEMIVINKKKKKKSLIDN